MPRSASMLTAKVAPLINITGHRRRRNWRVGDHAYIELKEVRPEKYKEFSKRLKQAFRRDGGVQWIKWSPTAGRVAVAYHPKRRKLDELAHIVDEVETTLGMDGAAFPKSLPDHPGDIEPLLRKAAELAIGGITLSTALALRLAPFKPRAIDIDLSAIFASFEHVPRLRHLLDGWLGKESSELLLILANSAAQALSQNPFTPLLGMVQRYTEFRALQSRRRVWRAQETDLCALLPEDINAIGDLRFSRQKRPIGLPEGPIEKYANEGWYATLGAFGIALADTHNFEKAAAALFGGLPKAAAVGRDAFISTLVDTLSKRGIIPFHIDRLYRLDRINCVVLQAALLQTGRFFLGEIVALESENTEDLSRFFQEAAALFNPNRPDKVSRRKTWTLTPLSRLDIPLANRHRKVGERLASRGMPVLGLVENDKLVALVETCSTGQMVVDDILALAKRMAIQVVLAAEDTATVSGFQAATVVRDDDLLPKTIRRLQRDGRVVCLIDWFDHEALEFADLAIGIRRPKPMSSPWRCDVLCRESLEDALFLLEACRKARKVSEQGVKLTLLGVAMSAAHATRGLQTATTKQIMRDMALANLLTLANGLYTGKALAKRERPVRTPPVPWHALTAEMVLDQFKSSRRGLSAKEAQSRRKKAKKTARPLFVFGRAVVEELKTPLAPFLAIGTGLSALVGSAADALMIGGVFGLNGLIGGTQRFRAERSIAALSRNGHYPVHILRSGKSTFCDIQDLVPGDVVALHVGDVVPADCRILEATALEVDESSLTGESLPVTKSEKPSFSAAVAERTSMLYEGTSIAAGTALAVVVAVGKATETQRALSFAKEHAPASGVETRLNALTEMTIPVSTVSGALLAGAGLLRGKPLSEVLNVGVSLAVAAVPEGLPLLATVSQLSAAKRLASHGVLVRNPRSIEAMGRITVLCADKTGTLTEGKISLHSVSNGKTSEPVGNISKPFSTILAAGLRASPAYTKGKKLPHLTDQAMIDGALGAKVTTELNALHWHRQDELPFEASRGYHAVLGKTEEQFLVSVKGAPEIILSRCTAWQNGRTRPVSAATRARLLAEAERLAKEGLRVLAIAERKITKRVTLTPKAISNLTFLGFTAFSDPARPAAAEAIQNLQQSGVDVIMMTGDHPTTAERIARELQLINGHRVVTGPEIDAIDDAALDALLPKISVIARVSPANKVRIIKAFQRIGKTVAMTGDGANDAGAIRLADVGIALSGERNAVATGAADLVLTDARIETIVDAIAEGRALWGSVRDAIAVLVGGNLGEVCFTLLTGLLSGRASLNARQLLLINLLTDVAPAMAIAVKAPKKSTLLERLQEGPEVSLGSALNRQIAFRAATTALAATTAWGISRVTGSRERADTVGLVTIVATQLGQTLLAGGRDKTVAAASIGSLATLLAAVEIPGLSHFFASRPLGPFDMATALATSAFATGISAIAPAFAPRLRRLSDRLALTSWMTGKMSKIADINRGWTEKITQQFH